MFMSHYATEVCKCPEIILTLQSLIATTFEVVHYIALQAVHYKPLQEVHLSRYNHIHCEARWRHHVWDGWK